MMPGLGFGTWGRKCLSNIVVYAAVSPAYIEGQNKQYELITREFQAIWTKCHHLLVNVHVGPVSSP